MELKRYPRQFVVADLPTKCLNDLEYFKIGTYHVYHCPTLTVYSRQVESYQKYVVLFGYASYPDNWNLSEIELLDKILNFDCLNDICKYISRLVGRYSIFLFVEGEGYVFHDPTGQRTVYYTTSPGIDVFGTQPLILGEFCKLEAGYKVELFFHSKYFKYADEYWLPSGLSIYENVLQLVPNHYLKLTTKQQIRYWPVEPLRHLSFDDTVEFLSSFLTEYVQSASKKQNLVLPLTSGFDSRVLLALSRGNIIDNLICFTRIQRKNINKYHQDVVIPSIILKSIEHKHNIIITDRQVSASDEERYKLNNSTSRLQEGAALFSSGNEVINNKYVMHGNVSEMIKIRKSGKPYLSLRDFDVIPKGWFEIGFIQRHLQKWYDTAANIENDFGLHPYELFYWEHRLGNWAARSYNENDFAFDVFTPFNSRDVLSVSLMLDICYRSLPEAKLHRAIIYKLWPEIDKYPYNKMSFVELMKARFKKACRITRLDRLILGFNNFINQ